MEAASHAEKSKDDMIRLLEGQAKELRAKAQRIRAEGDAIIGAETETAVWWGTAGPPGPSHAPSRSAASASAMGPPFTVNP